MQKAISLRDLNICMDEQNPDLEGIPEVSKKMCKRLTTDDKHKDENNHDQKGNHEVSKKRVKRLRVEGEH